MIQTLEALEAGKETLTKDGTNSISKTGERQNHQLVQNIYKSPSDKLLISPISAKLSNPHKHLTKLYSINDNNQDQIRDKLNLSPVNLTSKLKSLDLN